MQCRLWLQLVQVIPSRRIRALHGHADTYKLIGELGDEWETPRAPYRVSFHIKARMASQGSEDSAEPYFSTVGKSPVEAVLGSGALPPGELALHHVVFSSDQYLTLCL